MKIILIIGLLLSSAPSFAACYKSADLHFGNTCNNKKATPAILKRVDFSSCTKDEVAVLVKELTQATEAIVESYYDPEVDPHRNEFYPKAYDLTCVHQYKSTLALIKSELALR